MKRIAVGALILAMAPCVFAQPGPPPGAALPMILNAIPDVDNLDRAEEFYHRLLGLESTQGDPRARLAWYAVPSFLADMNGVQGKTRNIFLRAPGTEVIFEPRTFDAAKGKRLDTHIQDPGAAQFIFGTRDIDQLTAWLTKGGAKVHSAGGKPIVLSPEAFSDGGGGGRAIEFDDFSGFFVRLVQRDVAAKPPLAATAFLNGTTIGATIEDTEKTARFYHDLLGVDVKMGSFVSDPKVLESYGLKGGQVRESVVAFPDKNPPLHFFEFKGVARKALHPGTADPNSLMIRIAVRDVEGIMGRVKAAGGQIMNVSGGLTINGKVHWLVVRDPDGFNLQLMGS
jgi:predicted enzyme related to lactoylglutathione lyase